MKAATIVLATVVVSTATVAGAQQQRPPLRQLGATTARSTEPLGLIAAVRQVGGGSVLVNDVPRRRVLLFDSTLTRFTVVADSTSATSSAYSGRMAGLLPYRGDSALFVDPTSLSMMVIDPNGKLGRVMSVPRSEDAMMLAGSFFGVPGFDPMGRLIYRGSLQRMMRPPGAPGGSMSFPSPPDSAPIVRVDLATRKLDTVTFVRTPRIKYDVTQVEGRTTMTSQVNPLPVVDDWAVLSNGSLAVVRGQDYHVDIFGPDGSKVSAPKMAFDWQRLSDEDKIAFIDSVKAARERMRAAAPAEQMTVGGGTAGGGGASTEMRVTVGGSAEGRAAGAAAAGGRFTTSASQLNFVPPSELPDYKPAFFAGNVRADADGNLWIRTIPTNAIPGGPVYDVVNSRGELVDRVQIPAQRNIVGFGSGGTVYLAVSENGSFFLERARVR